MNKIYQVFVSSTYSDLQEERKEVMQALLELDCMPAGMELFPASNEDQWTLIKHIIDSCDYYILIIGGRYGSTNAEGKSFTQMEFEYALENGKPIISFLPRSPELLPVGKCDNDPEKKEKLENFKEIVQRKMIKYWDNAEQLGSIVSRSMIKLIRDFPSEGWVKSQYLIDEKSVKELLYLQNENKELKQKLHDISIAPPSGTEIYAQGDDLVSISYSLSAYQGVGFDRKRILYHYEDEFSWNTIFSTIAPSMINETSEFFLKYYIEELISKTGSWRKEACLEGTLSVSHESFELIIIQLRTLGYIVLSERKRAPKDSGTYWKLTPYGDYVMTKLLARKKEKTE